MKKDDTRPLAEQVADDVLNHIVEHGLQPGTKIPNEFELMSQLGVSRTTVREAVKILVSRNILEIKRGDGTYVSYKQGVVEDPLGLSFVKDKKQLAMDLFDVRILLEPEIAAMAAVNATEEEAQKIQELCDKVEMLYESGEDHMPADIAFHEYIAHCSRNTVIAKLIPVINTSVDVFVLVTRRKLKQETLVTHRQVADAISRHDAASARYAMMMHLIYNRQMIAGYSTEQYIEKNVPINRDNLG